MRIVGLMPVYNESDIVEQAIDHLISQGIELVLIDDGSADGSYEICSTFLGKGVLSRERLSNKYFEFQLILQRLFETAQNYAPDWTLLSGADEFLESPYRGLTLKDAIELESSKGHNLIQFDNFEFWPTEKDHDSKESDVRKRLRYYSWQDDFQFLCWKVYPGMTVHETGGHIPRFPEGVPVRVSPNKFVLRYYKIRSYEHGLRKVFRERLPRYSPELRKKGWHVRYDNFGKERNYFVIDSNKLTKYEENGNWNLTKTFDGSFGAWNPPSINERIAQLER
jgi:glycosyltransferase involved in cell wall biosynthesis